MKTKREIYGKTPNGGVLAVLYFKGQRGQPVTEKEAWSVEIVEYNKRGQAIFRTYSVPKEPRISLDNVEA